MFEETDVAELRGVRVEAERRFSFLLVCCHFVERREGFQEDSLLAVFGHSEGTNCSLASS